MEEEVAKKPNFFKRHWKLLLMVFGIVIVLAVGTIIGLKALKDSQSGERIEQVVEPGCKKPEFTHPVTDLSKVDAIVKLGGVTCGSPARSYITIKEGEVPVYAPGDMTLETIVYARRGGSETNGEYGLYFSAGCNVTVLLDHLDKVSDELKTLAPQQPAESSRTELGTRPNKKIKAGTLVGYSDGTPQARTFDFLVMDRSKVVEHINPTRWEWDQSKYGVCPYDFYTPDLRESFLAKVGYMNEGVFTAEDGCGIPSQDVTGTLSGGWFKGASTDTKGEFLGIGQNAVKVELAIRRDGSLGTFSLQDWTAGKKRPKDVKVGEEICYSDQGSNLWAWIKNIGDNEISFAKGSGKCPAAFPESQAEVWER